MDNETKTGAVRGNGNFGIVVPLGPGDIEISRANDLLDSLFTYEPECRYVVLIDDVPQPRDLRKLLPQLNRTTCTTQIFENPRRGKGHGWSGGMCVGVSAGTEWLASNTKVDFVLRVDTDSLIIAPFYDRTVSIFQANQNIGLIGSCHHYPNGKPRQKTDHNTELKKCLRPMVLDRKRDSRCCLRFQNNLLPRGRRRAELLRRAIANGYRFGEHCQGGGYAISRSLLDTLLQDPGISDHFLFRDFYLPEDVMMGIFCRACGFEMRDANQVGEIFGVEWLALPGTPPQLVERGYSIIHAVKTYGKYNEEETRQFFTSKRLEDKGESTP